MKILVLHECPVCAYDRTVAVFNDHGESFYRNEDDRFCPDGHEMTAVKAVFPWEMEEY